MNNKNNRPLEMLHHKTTTPKITVVPNLKEPKRPRPNNKLHKTFEILKKLRIIHHYITLTKTQINIYTLFF